MGKTAVKNTCFSIISIFFLHTGTAQMTFQYSKPCNENIPPDTAPERIWWNLLHYTIDITPDYKNKYITGTNSIRFRALQNDSVMEIDLQKPMAITTITWFNKPLKFYRSDNTYFVSFPRLIQKDEMGTITVHFKGHPQVAISPPWGRGGWIWAKDKKGRPWMGTACEDGGASTWLPCKEVMYDEPDDGISFSITVPDSLVAVANGRLQKKVNNKNGTATYSWNLVNPINDYDIAPYIGKYVSWHKIYDGLKGKLDCDFWVIDYNLDKAQKHLQQVDTVLKCFEYWLGPYPFYEDSYKLVESPMLGMEHQSAIAYGNGFENGYSGKNLSSTVWGLKWDFILVHESGHEWFGNSITAAYGGESWIHEGFTKYLETLYTDYVFGTEAGNDYSIGIWKRIVNDEPVLGSGTSDQYNKASAVLHMIRQIIGDSIFRGLLHGLSKTFYHQTVSTEQIIHFINQFTKQDFTKIFDQYLRTTKVPLLDYSFHNDYFQYRWQNCVDGFNMPVRISFDNQKNIFIYPIDNWKKMPYPVSELKEVSVDRNFYIQIKEIQ